MSRCGFVRALSAIPVGPRGRGAHLRPAVAAKLLWAESAAVALQRAGTAVRPYILDQQE